MIIFNFRMPLCAIDSAWLIARERPFEDKVILEMKRTGFCDQLCLGHVPKVD